MDDIKLRVWAEFMEPEDLVKKKVIDLLKKFDVTLHLAVPEEKLDDKMWKVFQTYTDKKRPISPWLLLKREDGYFPNERNAKHFSQYAIDFLEKCDKKGVSIKELSVDLEPPLYLMDRLKHRSKIKSVYNLLAIGRENLSRRRFAHASSVFGELEKALVSKGVTSFVPIAPFLIEDILTGRSLIQDILESPVFVVPWDKISPMLYTSMIIQGFRGRYTREDTTHMVYSYMKDLVAWNPSKASVSLGVTGKGILETEATFETADELREDASAALAAGVKDFAIYNLEGIVDRPKPEEWFDAVAGAQPVQPAPSRKVNRLRSIIRTTSSLLDGLR